VESTTSGELETGRLACPTHPGAEVVGTCDRCGRFACAECLPRGEEVCVDCRGAVEVDAAKVQLQRLIRGMAISEGLRALLLALVVMMVGSALATQEESRTFWFGAIAITIPFFAMGVLLWVSKRPVIAWFAVALDVLFFGALAIAQKNPVAIGMLLLPVSTLVRAVRIHKLAKQVKAAQPTLQ
jgi:hypothetical protein